jgi:Uma2 family endonuclease
MPQSENPIALNEYLNTSYSPDCEYVNGRILERNWGERDHSRLHALLTAYLVDREKQWGIVAFVSLRVQVAPARIRVPDICAVLLPEPKNQILHEPPFLCIEILSQEDRAMDMEEKIADYRNFGVQYVWIIDPKTRKAYVYTPSSIHRANDGLLTTQNPDISISLPELYRSRE